jgi:hypothetical protein
VTSWSMAACRRAPIHVNKACVSTTSARACAADEESGPKVRILRRLAQRLRCHRIAKRHQKAPLEHLRSWHG